MPNITETISLLDELRGLLELYNKKREKGLHITGEEEDVIRVMERSVNTIEALRQAALDGERYRNGAKILEDYLLSGTLPEDDCAALTLYRQAVEQKEV